MPTEPSHSNHWVVTLSEAYIATFAPNPYRFPVSPLNAHLFTDNLLQHELDDEGFYIAIREAVVTWLLTNVPTLREDPTFPEYLTITYANTRRDHLAPGADHLRALSHLQPPTVWTIDATLASEIHHKGFTAAVIPITTQEP